MLGKAEPSIWGEKRRTLKREKGREALNGCEKAGLERGGNSELERGSGGRERLSNNPCDVQKLSPKRERRGGTEKSEKKKIACFFVSNAWNSLKGCLCLTAGEGRPSMKDGVLLRGTGVLKQQRG